ncbi:MAG: hypothetical protein H0T42_22995 [Deltaproteobacteria bacterium]|nr:hypothetical protein [Deltaproteobacteria bacterium]
MIRTSLSIALVLALAGCKKEPRGKGQAEADMAKMQELTDQMCACRRTDKACADRVQDAMTKYSIDMAAQSSSVRDIKPTAAEMKKMTELGQKYAECMTAAVTQPEPLPPSPEPVPPATPWTPAEVKAPATVEQLLAAARAWAPGVDDQFRIADLEAFYVDADGIVDADSGRVTIEPGLAPPGQEDDPKRRTGAPVKPSAARSTACLEVSWTAENGWARSPRSRCFDALTPFPRCTVAAIWKRAIAKGAPADALAVLKLREGAPRRWSFAIKDQPRNVDIRYSFDDDCELAVEKP